MAIPTASPPCSPSPTPGASTVANPLLTAQEIAALRSAHTGQASGLIGGNRGGANLGDNVARGYHVELADLDGDGRHDIVAAFAGEESASYERSGCPDGWRLQAWKAVLNVAPDKGGE